MERIQPMNLRLVVKNESSLYDPFSPGEDFSDALRKYIRTKIVGKDDHQTINMTVTSRTPLNEERFRSAVANWITDEKGAFRKMQKEMLRLLVVYLVLGSLLIILRVMLEPFSKDLQYTILPILASFSLGRAAAIMIVDLPRNSRYKKLINEMEQNCVITFVYGCEQNTEKSMQPAPHRSDGGSV